MQVSINNMLVQIVQADKWRDETHAALLADGFTWDGQDGYTAPEGYSIAKLLQLTTKEAF